jgi:colanic acid/amylovoran biosynthesis protein
MKIALIGARLSTNFGGPSLFVSTRAVLNQVFRNAEYTLLVPSAYYQADTKLSPKYDVKVAPFYKGKALLAFALLKRITGRVTGSSSVKATLMAIEDCDVIIDIRGLIYQGSRTRTAWRRIFGPILRGFRGGINEACRFAVNRILHKPVVKYTSSLGPFDLKWSRIFARLYFGYFTDLILARDEASFHEIEKLRIKTPVLLVPDTAFLLPACESKESERYATLGGTIPLIGVSVSYQARNRAPASVDYIEIMADFVNYLIAKHHVHIVLIPNELTGGRDDDRLVAESILARVKSDHCDVLNTEELLAQEMKGLISRCEVIVAARYHTIIAALSLGIPTLAVGWHHKYAGVLRLFKQEDRVCNIEALALDDMVEKFEVLWDGREEIRKAIKGALPDVEYRIRTGAKAVHDIVSAKLNLGGAG